jgi:hypothetical protein
MRCLRIYATPDGESRFDEVELPTPQVFSSGPRYPRAPPSPPLQTGLSLSVVARRSNAHGCQRSCKSLNKGDHDRIATPKVRRLERAPNSTQGFEAYL